MVRDLQEGITDAVSTSNSSKFNTAEIKCLVDSMPAFQIYEQVYRDRFIQVMKEVGEDVHMDLCFECQVIQTGRSRHCYSCQQCIDVWDHHCPWINNCVGKSNYSLFCLFLLLMDCYAGIMCYLHAFLLQVAYSQGADQSSGVANTQ